MVDEIFEVKRHGEDTWVEVTKEEWIREERASGFVPKMSSSDPRFMTTCATSGFGSSRGSSGRRRAAS